MPQVDARSWKYLVLHHTASAGGNVDSIHEAHVQRKDKQGRPWKGIGYHFVIGNGDGMADGAIEPTFRWREQMHGAHAGVPDYNNSGIGIVLVGNFETQKPTAAQVASVQRLVRALALEYGISAENIIGHRDVKATACPGQHFPLSDIKQHIAFSVGGNRSHEDTRFHLTNLKEHQEQ
ncbi:MAG: peptidoglycan recognition family protein [Planctomycetaceae bacterium]